MKNPLRLFALGAVGAAVLVSAACGDGGGDEGGGEAVDTTVTTMSTTAPEATDVALMAEMSGKEEVPGPGVTDGTGVAEVSIKGEELCYKLNATMGEKPTAAHIHQGAKGASGPVVVDLKPTFTQGESAFTSESCVTPDAAQVTAITASPDGFYVNVHTAEHPNGAIRGQLGKSGS
ncbi:MAG: CHRD domain-containing protein [Actinomycetota bacterium]|nr:CHRD domain-containing protein [Actinomycetota bacterium]